MRWEYNIEKIEKYDVHIIFIILFIILIYVFLENAEKKVANNQKIAWR